MTWYWKQNEIVDLLKEQNRLLRIMVDSTQTDDDNDDDNDDVVDDGSEDVTNEMVEAVTADALLPKVDNVQVLEDDSSKLTKMKKTFFDKVKDAEQELKHKK